MELLSPAQCAGYAAFVLGVAAFLQKSDRRLKLYIAVEALVYALHFSLLGNYAASASSVISCARNFLSLKYRSPWLAAAIFAVAVAAGAAFAGSGAGWLPIIASCAATVAIFMMRGISMRLVLLACTLLWLVNNILSGSIGGTMLESAIAIVNAATIVRMVRASAGGPFVAAEENAGAEA